MIIRQKSNVERKDRRVIQKTVIILITRKALGERRSPPSSTVPPYNDSH